MTQQHTERPVLTLAEEIAQSRTRGRRPAFSEDERKERAKQAARAQTLALSALKVRHEDEYQQLYAQAKAEVGLD